MSLYTFYTSFSKNDGDPQFRIKTIEAATEHLARRDLITFLLGSGFQVAFIKLKGKDAVFNTQGNSPHEL